MRLKSGGIMENSIGERIKKVRKSQGLNQKDFATQLGISQTHISGIESNKEKPSLTLIKLISIKFYIDEEWLLNGSEQPLYFMLNNLDGILQKYKIVQSTFDNLMKHDNLEILYNIVNAYSSFVSSVCFAFRTDINFDSIIYIEKFAQIIDLLEKLIFRASLKIKPAKNNTDCWIKELNFYTEQVNEIDNLIKDTINIVLLQFGEHKKI